MNFKIILTPQPQSVPESTVKISHTSSFKQSDNKFTINFLFLNFSNKSMKELFFVGAGNCRGGTGKDKSPFPRTTHCTESSGSDCLDDSRCPHPWEVVYVAAATGRHGDIAVPGVSGLSPVWSHAPTRQQLVNVHCANITYFLLVQYLQNSEIFEGIINKFVFGADLHSMTSKCYCWQMIISYLSDIF